MPSLVGLPVQKLTIMLGGTCTKVVLKKTGKSFVAYVKGAYINVFLSAPLSS
jgi:hypothetical protein